MARKGIKMLVLGIAVMALAACGIKSSPRHPADTTYPLIYPNAGVPSKASSPATTSGSETEKQTKDAPRSPLGFPLEYPNRATYN